MPNTSYMSQPLTDWSSETRAHARQYAPGLPVPLGGDFRRKLRRTRAVPSPCSASLCRSKSCGHRRFHRLHGPCRLHGFHKPHGLQRLHKLRRRRRFRGPGLFCSGGPSTGPASRPQ